MLDINKTLSLPTISLRVTELSFSRAQVKIIDSISHEFAAAQVTLLSGPSGCGKTTLLRLLAGLEIPNNGEITANGILWSNAEQVMPPWQRNLDMLFQGDALWPNQTVGEQMHWVRTRNNSACIAWNIDEISESLGIKNLLNRFPAGLSGGEARRCQLARVLAGNPSLMLLDEPLSGQDAETAAKTARMLGTLLAKAQITAIIVSHETEPFANFAWKSLYLPDINGKQRV